MADDISVAILREIRDEIRETRKDLSQRIDQTNARLDQTNERLGHVEGAMVELAEQQRFMVRIAKAGQERDRRLEHELLSLRGRIDAVEARLDEG